MNSVTRTSGITVTTTGALGIVQPPVKRGGHGRVRSTPDPLLEILSGQELELVDTIPLTIPEKARPRKRGAATAHVTLDVPLGDNEQAVLLVEDEGVYRWVVGGEAVAPLPAKRKRGAATTPPATGRLRRFTVQVQPAPPAEESAGRPRKRGKLTDAVLGKVKVYVFRFAADFAVRLAGAHAVRFLERKVRQGLVAITATDPEQWQDLADEAPLPQALPNGRPPRILLLIHGTFSSTRGSFGALGLSPVGRHFLERAFAEYDAVLGFDHPTLSVDPLANATALLTRLQRIAWPAPPKFHMVAFSRGGLVARSFIEQLLPAARWPVVIDRVAFVACTNGGTQLAEPDNWHRLADRYTNVALWGARGLALIPGAQGFAGIAREAIQGVGALVKILATAAVTDNLIPGLAAMEPDGPFVSALNQTQPEQPTPADSFYAAVTSDFEASIALRDLSTPELPAKLLMSLADHATDALYGEPNDLVVHTRSMTAIDPLVGGFVKDVLDFGSNGLVYHTNYFTRPETAGALLRWFGLDRVAGGGRPLPPARRGARRAPMVKPGAVVGSTASSQANPNILVVKAADTAGSVKRRLDTQQPDYLVVEREHQGDLLYYAFAPDEVKATVRRTTDKAAVVDVLKLQEFDRSDDAPDSAAVGLKPMNRQERPSRSRTVLLSGAEPVGVVPSSADLPRMEEAMEAAIAPEPEPRPAPRRRAAVRRSSPRKRGGGGGGGGGGVRRRAAAAPATAASAAAAQGRAPATEVECQFRAEMDEEVVADQVTDVAVTISREQLEAATRGAVASGAARVSTQRTLIVQIAARRNFRIDSERRVEVPVPKPGSPQSVFFDVVGLSAGESGELWVQVRQGPMPLVTLKLFPSIVSERSGASRRTRAAADIAELPPAEKPLDQIIVQESFVGDIVRYDFLLDLHSLKLRHHFQSDPLPGARDDYIRQILNEIGDSWASGGKDSLTAFERSLRAIGGKMFSQLIPRDMQTLLWENRERIHGMQVFSMEPFIPWELVYIKEPGKRVLPKESRFLGELGLVRWLYEGYPPREIPLRSGRARYVVPNYPPGLELPEAGEEAALLQTLFKAKAVKPQLNTIETLLETPGNFDLLHFAGHGEAAGTESSHSRLLIDGQLEGERFVGDALSATTVEQIAQLSDGESHPMVILNACESARRNREFAGMGGFADAFVRAGAGVFVGTHWSVADRPARTFIETFYRAFAGVGRKAVRLSDAVTRARQAARDGGDATWLSYVVYGHPNAKITR